MNDTCLGINNEGQLVFDYWNEDSDIVDGAQVYNGQTSVLWVNFRTAFADEIRSMYQSLRNNNKITYDLLYSYFITNQSDKWAMTIYNEDSEYKYISMLRSDGDASNLDQVRGNGEEHFKYFMKNRIKYCDSKWYAGDYANNYVTLRIYTPVDANTNQPLANLAVPADADVTVTAFSNMYVGIRYGANGTLYQQRVSKNEVYTFDAPNQIFNDTETAVYGASEISSLGDLSPLYCGTINVSNATKLTELIIGNGTNGYQNTNLKSLSIGTNALLKKINVENCSALTNALALANCPNIEEIYARGSSITGVELADAGFIRVMQLPSTIINLTLKNQLYIVQLTLEGYDAIRTLYIDNCPTVDTLQLIQSCPNLTRLHLTGIDWSFSNPDFMESLYSIGGLDGNRETEYPYLVGHVHITSLRGDKLLELQEHFPYVDFTYSNLNNTIYYYNYDGSSLITTENVANGGDGTYSGTPSRTATEQYTYTFIGWSSEPESEMADDDILNNITIDTVVYAAYSRTVRSYTIYWQDMDGSILEIDSNVLYGSMPIYNGATPSYNEQIFTEWLPVPSAVVSDMTYVAQYVPSYTVSFYNEDTLLQTMVVIDGGSAQYTGTTPTSSVGTFLEWNPPIPTSVHDNVDCYAVFDIPIVQPDLKYLNYSMDYTNHIIVITGLNVTNIIADNLSNITIPNVFTINGEQYTTKLN